MPTFGPIETLMSYTGLISSGTTSKLVAPRSTESTGTGILIAGDRKGYVYMRQRDFSQLSTRWFTQLTTGVGYNIFTNSFPGSAQYTNKNDGNLSATQNLQYDYGTFNIRPTTMEVKITNGSPNSGHFRVYLLRVKRVNNNKASAIDYSVATWPDFLPAQPTTGTSIGTDIANAMNPVWPHTNFMNCPTIHRFWECLSVRKCNLKHGESKTLYIPLPECNVMGYEAFWDSTHEGDLDSINGVSLEIVVEGDWDPSMVNTQVAGSGVSGLAQPMDAIGTAQVTCRWNESVRYRPNQKLWGTRYTVPNATQTIITAAGQAGITGANYTMNEYGTGLINANPPQT